MTKGLLELRVKHIINVMFLAVASRHVKRGIGASNNFRVYAPYVELNSCNIPAEGHLCTRLLASTRSLTRLLDGVLVGLNGCCGLKI